MAAKEDFRFTPLKRGALLRVEKQLQDPSRLLRPIGMMLLADAQRAFKEQRLGELIWPERYAKQRPPKVNIAGIVADLNQGRKSFPRRRFEGRPAGIDTGLLLRSLASAAKAVQVNGWEVKVGSTVEYAGRFHDGGISTQRITKNAKELLAAYLRKKRKQVKSSKAKGTPLTGELAAVSRLGFLFSKDTLKTKSPPRPFLGVTDVTARKIVRFLQSQFTPGGAAEGGASA